MACITNQVAQLVLQVYEDQKFRKEVLQLLLIDSVTLVGIVTVLYFYYRWWSKHPLYGQNQGPKAYPVVGTVPEFVRNINRLPDFNLEYVRRYPNHTIRGVRPGGKSTYLTANPANVEYILKTNFENYPKGNYFKDLVRDLLGNGIFNADDHLWRIQRKVASYEFTTRSLRDFSLDCATKETTGRLLPFFHQASKTGQIFDLQDVFARFAFDNICQLGFGVDPACLDISLPRVRFAEAFDQATFQISNKLRTLPIAIWQFKAALDIGGAKELRLAVAEIDKFAMEVIKTRRKELAAVCAGGKHEAGSGKSDLLSRFMSLVDDRDEGGQDLADMLNHEVTSAQNRLSNSRDIFLRDVIISFILAGKDTSTSALSWFFWLLSRHPGVERAILVEISQVLSSRPAAAGEGGAATGIDSEKSSLKFSFEELKSMHYLHAALMESMRLYPPVPSDVKFSKRADVWPDGTIIDPNSLVIYLPYSMGRLEDLWGKDALEFKPDRWLKDGVFVPQSPFKYPVFQAGPRVCLGKDMVMLQMKLMCAAILPSFEICCPKDYKPQYVASLTLFMKDGFPVTVRKRSTGQGISDKIPLA